jgi:hypothetical protein
MWTGHGKRRGGEGKRKIGRGRGEGKKQGRRGMGNLAPYLF